VSFDGKIFRLGAAQDLAGFCTHAAADRGGAMLPELCGPRNGRRAVINRSFSQ